MGEKIAQNNPSFQNLKHQYLAAIAGKCSFKFIQNFTLNIFFVDIL